MIATAWALISSEAIKVRRTLAIWAAVVTPLLAVLYQLVSLLNRDLVPPGPPDAVWISLLTGVWGGWLGFFLPMLIAIEAAELFGLEHRGQMWKQTLTFPAPRWSVYAVKMLYCALFVGVAFAIVTAGFIGNVVVFHVVHGVLPSPAIPWQLLLPVAAKAWVACLALIAVQTWISSQFSSIILNLGIAFAALVLGFVVMGLMRQNGPNWMWWYPWVTPSLTYAVGRDHHNTFLPILFGSAGGAVVAVIVCYHLSCQREIK